MSNKRRNRNGLFIIDWQNDFAPTGAFTGALGNMPNQTTKVAQLINDNTDVIDFIGATQDTHQPVDCSHPIWWAHSDGTPFDQAKDIYINIAARIVTGKQ